MNLSKILLTIFLGLLFIGVFYLMYDGLKKESLDMKNIVTHCREFHLTYRLKNCGFGCGEQQCYNESNIYEVIIKGEDVTLIPK